jgi:hypothetical protein
MIIVHVRSEPRERRHMQVGAARMVQADPSKQQTENRKGHMISLDVVTAM